IIRYVVPAGIARQIYASSAGRLLLAYSDEDWRERYLRKVKLKQLTKLSIVDKDRLRDVLVDIRASGYATSIDEAVRGAAGIAAPVFNSEGVVEAALLIGAPSSRLVENRSALERIV